MCDSQAGAPEGSPGGRLPLNKAGAFAASGGINQAGSGTAHAALEARQQSRALGLSARRVRGAVRSDLPPLPPPMPAKALEYQILADVFINTSHWVRAGVCGWC